MRKTTVTAIALVFAALLAIPSATQIDPGQQFQVTKAIGDFGCLISEFEVTHPSGVVERLLSGVDPDDHGRLVQSYSTSDGVALSIETVCSANTLLFRVTGHGSVFTITIERLTTAKGDPRVVVRHGKQFFHALAEIRFNDKFVLLNILIPTEEDGRETIVEPEDRFGDFIETISQTDFGMIALRRAAAFVFLMPSTPVIDILREFLSPFAFVSTNCAGDSDSRQECGDCCDDKKERGEIACNKVSPLSPAPCAQSNQAMQEFLVCINDGSAFSWWDYVTRAIAKRACLSAISSIHKKCSNECDSVHGDL